VAHLFTFSCLGFGGLLALLVGLRLGLGLRSRRCSLFNFHLRNLGLGGDDDLLLNLGFWLSLIIINFLIFHLTFYSGYKMVKFC
jgi:hypothetical protein